jgi:hypothetical protein
MQVQLFPGVYNYSQRKYRYEFVISRVNFIEGSNEN